MKRFLIIGLTLLLSLTLGVACADNDASAAAQAEPAEEEHPQRDEEHPEGEPAEGEEHPEGEGEEHPEGEGEEGEEHPEGEGEEHPEEDEPPQQAVERVTVDELAEAITEWVAAEAAANGGFLVIEHPDTGESLELTLEEVHRERLSRVGEQTYFACADFVDRDGVLYDLDVFMRGPNREALKTTEVTLHKEDGTARYAWYEEDGVWKRRPPA
jgi:hypothetical protein